MDLGLGRRRRPSPRGTSRAGYLFVGGYVALFALFGIGPSLYAVYLSVTNGSGQFVGLGQFIRTAQDFRFDDAFLNVATYVFLWVAVLVVLTLATALILHQQAGSVSLNLRLLFYMPGALAGVASVLVWIFMLDPETSPVGWLFDAFGITSGKEVIQPQNLPWVFVVMAFWTGAGGWIVIMYGALNNIPVEVIEAARIDGASRLQIAFRIQLPMIKKWIAYMAVLAFSTGTQIFAEPQIVGLATQGGVVPYWSTNQLGYTYAFEQNDFNGSAAISMYLLVLGIAGALLLVFKSGLFEVEER